MSSEFPETELIVSIAEDVEKLSSLLGPKYHLDIKTALSCVELYKSTFGDEGFSALEKEVNFLSKYIYEKPEAEGLQQIHKFQSKLELLKTFQFTNYYDKKAYQSFIKSEKDEIAAFTNKFDYNTLNDVIEKYYPHLKFNYVEDGYNLFPEQIAQEYKHDYKKLFVNENKDVRAGDGGWKPMNPEFEKQFRELSDDWDEMTRKEMEKETFERKWLLGITQGNSLPLEMRNINSKENFMSNEFNSEEKTFRPSLDAAANVAKEEAFTNALHQRKMVINGLKTGTLSCLPGTDGFADTKPAVNVTSGDFYHGVNLLDLKDHQKQNGFPTAEYVTENMIDKASESYPDLKIAQDQRTKGIFIHWEEKKGPDEWERKSVKLYNIAQTTNPEQIKAWADQKQQENYQKYVDFKKKENPAWTPPEPKQNPAPIIECTSTEPEKYLGQYLAAVSMGGKFKASPEQAAEFSKKMEGALTEEKENGYPDPYKLSKISNAASKYCKDVKTETNMTLRKELYKEQKQEQQQSRGGRGM